jgi:hypothetical protein
MGLGAGLVLGVELMAYLVQADKSRFCDDCARLQMLLKRFHYTTRQCLNMRSAHVWMRND